MDLIVRIICARVELTMATEMLESMSEVSILNYLRKHLSWVGHINVIAMTTRLERLGNTKLNAKHSAILIELMARVRTHVFVCACSLSRHPYSLSRYPDSVVVSFFSFPAFGVCSVFLGGWGVSYPTYPSPSHGTPTHRTARYCDASHMLVCSGSCEEVRSGW
jgi:hypothetical protein